MNLKEVDELINIRQYVANTIGSFSIDRETAKYVNGLLIMIDKKILTMLKSDEFKEYVNYKDVTEATKEVAKLNNIKFGINNKRL